MANALTINCQPVPWSYYWRVVKLVNGDKEAANRVMFRAAMAKPASVIAWISKGFVPDENGHRYALKPCMAEEHGSAAYQAWVEANIGKYRAKKQPVAIKSDLKNYLIELAGSL